MSYLGTLHNAIIKHLNLEELQQLTLELEIEFDDLPSSGRAGKAMDLVKYMARKERLPVLLEALHQHHPQISWPEVPPNYKYSPQSILLPQAGQSYIKWLLPVLGGLLIVCFLIVAAVLFIASQKQEDETELPLIADTNSIPLSLRVSDSEYAFDGRLFINLTDIDHRRQSVALRITSPGYDVQEVTLVEVFSKERYASDSIFEVMLFDLDPIPDNNSAVFVVSEITENKEIQTFEDLNASQGNAYILVDYSVQEGDTLSSISENLKTTENVLILYGIEEEDITPGNVIRIPVVDPNYCGQYPAYIVKSGDTLYSIASQFETSVEGIIASNNFNPDINSTYTGTIICIPFAP